MNSSSRNTARLAGPGGLQRAVSHFFEGGAPVMLVWSRNKERLDECVLALTEELAAEGSTIRRHQPSGMEALLAALNALVEDLSAHELGGVGSSNNLRVLVIDSAEQMSAEEIQSVKRVVIALAASPVRFIVGACTASQPFLDATGKPVLPSAVAWDLDADPIGVRDDSKLELAFIEDAQPPSADPTTAVRAPASTAGRRSAPSPDGDSRAILWFVIAGAALFLFAIGWNWPELSRSVRGWTTGGDRDPARVQFDCGQYANAAEAKVVASAVGPAARLVPATQGPAVQVQVGPFTSTAELETTRAKIWTLGACSLVPKPVPAKR